MFDTRKNAQVLPSSAVGKLTMHVRIHDIQDSFASWNNLCGLSRDGSSLRNINQGSASQKLCNKRQQASKKTFTGTT